MLIWEVEQTPLTINSFSPTQGEIGTIVTINGTGFLNGQLTASINGISQTITVLSDTEATITLASATTSGKISISSPTETILSTTNFTVTPASNNWTIGYGLELISNELRNRLHKIFSSWERNQRVLPVFFTDAATVALDLQESQHFYGTLSQNATFSWSNLQSGMSWQVQITATATRTITWPAGIQWRGSQPTVSAGMTLIQFTTLDGTNVWGG